MQSLPEETLMHVLSNLDKTTLHRVGLVNTLFLRLSQDLHLKTNQIYLELLKMKAEFPFLSYSPVKEFLYTLLKLLIKIENSYACHIPFDDPFSDVEAMDADLTWEDHKTRLEKVMVFLELYNTYIDPTNFSENIKKITHLKHLISDATYFETLSFFKSPLANKVDAISLARKLLKELLASYKHSSSQNDLKICVIKLLTEHIDLQPCWNDDVLTDRVFSTTR